MYSIPIEPINGPYFWRSILQRQDQPSNQNKGPHGFQVSIPLESMGLLYIYLHLPTFKGSFFPPEDALYAVVSAHLGTLSGPKLPYFHRLSTESKFLTTFGGSSQLVSG